MHIDTLNEVCVDRNLKTGETTVEIELEYSIEKDDGRNNSNVHRYKIELHDDEKTENDKYIYWIKSPDFDYNKMFPERPQELLVGVELAIRLAEKYDISVRRPRLFKDGNVEEWVEEELVLSEL